MRSKPAEATVGRWGVLIWRFQRVDIENRSDRESRFPQLCCEVIHRAMILAGALLALIEKIETTIDQALRPARIIEITNVILNIIDLSDETANGNLEACTTCSFTAFIFSPRGSVSCAAFFPARSLAFFSIAKIGWAVTGRTHVDLCGWGTFRFSVWDFSTPCLL